MGGMVQTSTIHATAAARDVREGRADARAALDLAGTFLLIASVTFNAALAAINAQGVPLGTGTVASVQALLVAGALLVALAGRPEGGARWAALLWLASLWFLLLALARGRLELRYLADIATIFVFVLLGLTLSQAALLRALVGLQGVILAFAGWEIVSPSSFAAMFDVPSYYVNTRGFDAEAFMGADLYISAERPGGRLLLPELAVHRASSLFLEPVSLGNWTIVVTLAAAALSSAMTRRQLLFLLGGNLLLLFACDGRLAMLINFFLLLNWWLAPRVPVGVATLYLPAVFLLLLTGTALGLLEERGDTLAGRLRYGIDYLRSLDAGKLLGLYDGGGIVAADSGWSYFVATQSLPALVIVWLAISLAPPGLSAAGRRSVSGTALFVALSLPVSYSVFSIKTAAWLWALYGCAVAGADRGARIHTPQNKARQTTPQPA